MEDHRAQFNKIVKKLRGHPREPEGLTRNQIAFLVLGKGSPGNAASIGRTLYEYHDYVIEITQGKGAKLALDWDAIDRDFGQGRPQNREPGAKPSRPFDEMLMALRDERDAVGRAARRNPLRLLGERRATELEQPGDVIYGFSYESPSDDDVFPLPDGAPVQIVWQDGTSRKAILLSHDEVASRLYAALDARLSQTLLRSPCRLEPLHGKLVDAIVKQVEIAMESTDGVHQRLLDSAVRPRRLRSHEVVDAGLDESQLATLRRACTEDVSLIWGPPGTGKTYLLGKAVSELVGLGLRILVVSIANVAVDQVCLKVRDALVERGEVSPLEKGQILRLGHARDPDVLQDHRFFPDRIEAQNLRSEIAEARRRLERPGLSAEEQATIRQRINNLEKELRAVSARYSRDARVVLTTAIQTCLDPAFEEAGAFDAVVIDEASMMPIPHLMATGHRAGQQIILAGDFRQLGPIAIAKSDAAERWLKADIFQLLGVSNQHKPRHATLSMLQVQRRMHADISACVNDYFYAGLLKNGASPAATSAAKLEPEPDSAVLFVPTPGPPLCVATSTSGGSRCNRGSAKITARLAALFRSQSREHRIGVITPYRAQARRIKDELRMLGCAEHIDVGTVHTFQGSERDVIIWDIVDTEELSIGMIYRGDGGNRLTNVAITRARGKLVVVGDYDAFTVGRGREALGKLREIFTQKIRPRKIQCHPAGPRIRVSGKLWSLQVDS